MRQTLAKMALGAVLAAGVGGAAALGFIASGRFDVRATTEHSQPVAWAIHRAMIASVRHGAGGMPPAPPLSPGQIFAGFAIYDARCAMCHGAPGVPRADWVAGLNPSPPFLLDSARHWTPRQLAWIVTNGIKMTPMPAWKITLTPRQIWGVVAFLRALPDLNAEDYARMRTRMAAHAAINPRLLTKGSNSSGRLCQTRPFLKSG